MQDAQKSKSQLIDELKSLRRRIAEQEQYLPKQKGFEKLLLRLFDQLPGCVYLKNSAGDYVYSNKYCTDLPGFDERKSIIDSKFHIFPNTAGHPLIKNKTNEPHAAINELYTNGEKSYWIDYKIPIKTDDGDFIAGISFDITNLNTAKREFYNSENRFRSFVAKAPYGIYYCDFAGNFIYGNEKAEKIIGCPAVDFTGKNMLELKLLRGKDRERMASILQKTGSGAATGPHSFTFHSKDGRRRKVEIFCEIISLAGRKVVLSIAQDITERLQKDRALKENEARYRAVVEQSRDCIFLVDMQTSIIIDANKALLDLLGYKLNEIRQKTIYDIAAHEKADIDRNTSRIMKKKGLHSRERIYRKKDGSIVQVEVNVSLIKYSGKKVASVVSHEISSKIKKEKELREQEERYRTLFEQSRDSIFVADLDAGIIVQANPASRELTGYTLDELIGLPYHRLFCDDPEKTEKSVRKLVQEKCYFNGKKEMRHRDGTQLHVDLSLSLVVLNGKNMASMICKDLSESRLAEFALKQSERSYRGLFDDASEAIYIQDREGRFLDVNKRAEKMYGYPREFFIGKTPEFVSAPGKNDLKDIDCRIEKAFQGEPQSFEFWGVDKYGRVFPKEVRLNRGTYFGNEVVVAYARDISKKLAYEHSRRQNEERLRTLYEYAPVGIVYTNPKSMKIISANKNFCRFIGYTNEELTQLGFPDFSHPDEAETDRKKVQSLFTNEINIFSREKRYIRKDRKIVWGRVTVSLIHDQQQMPQYIIAAVDDITQQKEAELERQKLQRHLQQAQKMEALITLAGGIAHDFNNALSAVVGNIELLNMQLPGNEIIEQHTQPILRSTARMTQLTNQLLAYAQGGKYQPQAIAIDRFIADNISIIKHGTPTDCDLSLNLHCGDERIMADSTQLHMMFSAVFANAAEAIGCSGKISLQTAVKIFTEKPGAKYPGLEPGNYVYISISDNGCGMDRETLEHIFEPFFTTKFRGRGLGMASVYGIIKNHNGFIYIDSQVGEGSVVCIFLPVHPAESPQVKKSAPEETKTTGTVLIIEDEALVANVIFSMLSHLDYQYLAAKSAEEARDIIQTYDGEIDIILLDMGLPDMPGDVLYPILKQSLPQAKTIICSGYSIDGPAQKVLQKGAEAFLQKPFSIDSLEKILTKVLK